MLTVLWVARTVDGDKELRERAAKGAVASAKIMAIATGMATLLPALCHTLSQAAATALSGEVLLSAFIERD